MGSLDNLIPFEKGNKMSKGRPKGSKNKSTIVKKWLNLLQNTKNDLTGHEEELTQEDLITIAMIQKAKKGSEQAYEKLMNNRYPNDETTTSQIIVVRPKNDS